MCAKDSSATTYLIVVLTLAATVLQISFLGSKSLWFDETLSAYRAGLPIRPLLHVITHGQMNMSLYYLMLKVWTSIAGTSEFMLRLPSALFAVGTIPLIYTLGTELCDRRTGLLAALLVTINATFIQYGQTARSYSMLVALVTLASAFFVRGVKRGTMASEVGYVASGTLSIYAHLFGIFALPSQWLSLFLFRPARKISTGLIACMLMIGILSVPAFYFAIAGDFGNEAWVARTSLDSVRQLSFIFAGASDGRVNSLTIALTALYGVGITLAILWTPRSDWAATGYALLSLCVPIGLAIVVSLVKPLFVARYFLAELPFFALLAALGFQCLRPGFSIAMVIAISTLSLAQDYSYYSAGPLEDWRGTVQLVASRSQLTDPLVIYPGFCSTAVEYYASRLRHPETFPARLLTEPSGRRKAENIERLLASSGIGVGGRIWFVVRSADLLRETTNGNTSLPSMLRDLRVIDESDLVGLRVFLLERAR